MGDRATATAATLDALAERLERLERQNAALVEQNTALSEKLESVERRYETLEREAPAPARSPGRSAVAPRLPGANPPASELSGSGSSRAGLIDSLDPSPATGLLPRSPWPAPGVAGGITASQPTAPGSSRFLVGERDMDAGRFVLVQPRDPEATPFALNFDVFTQARYLNFGRTEEFWVDSTGTRFPVRNYDSIEIPRNFLQFSGFAFDPRLQFTAFIFSSTALNDTVYLGWINYRFNKALDVRVGNWLVPGTREWFESFRFTMGSDRLLATTFFRPNISPGIWIQGEPLPNVQYVAMLANSINRFTQGIERLGAAKAFGGTVWWEPRGAFGPGPSDVEKHERWTPRLGMNLALSRELNQAASGGPVGITNPEDTILRLSDGTPVFRANALQPGTTLLATDIQLWTVDAGIKYRGFSIGGEYFLRLLDNLRSVGEPLRIGSLFDHGALLQTGYFVRPRLEAFARTSYVTGPFGGGNEFGGGLNWYPKGTRDWRMTLEVLRVDQSPAQNILTGYRAGETGMLYQLQWFTDF